MLCDRAKKVTVVEASKRRSELIYARHKKKDNLEVIVGNFNSIKFEEKFDYVVLVGVLEYAMQFCNKTKPFKAFLKSIAQVLKDDGRMFVAIENRNGLKYWSGASEDHLSKPYLGITGYKNQKVKTFGKIELQNLLKESGFNSFNFYYPLPDYKLPRAIYSDKCWPSIEKYRKDLIFNHDNYGYCFDPKDACENILQNKLFDSFANSFLVEASKQDKIDYNIIYAKMNSERKESYNTIIKISEDGRIIKELDKNVSQKHLRELEETHKALNKLGINNSKIVSIGDKCEIEYLEGKSLTEYIYEAYINEDKKKIENIFDEYIQYIENNLVEISKDTHNFITKEIEELYNNRECKILKIGLLDLNLSNVIKKDKKIYLIDQEWITKKDVPLEYVIYFSIKILYEQIPELSDFISENKFYEKYNIVKESCKIFNEASEQYFFNIKDVMDMETYKILNNQSFIELKENILFKNFENEKEGLFKNFENEKEGLFQNFENEKLNLVQSFQQEKNVDNLALQQEKIKNEELKRQLEFREKQYDELVNSRAGKCIRKLQKLKNKINKRKNKFTIK